MSCVRTRSFAVLAVLALTACAGEPGDTAGNTELNILVPDGGADAIDIGTVEYTIHCLGNETPGFLDNNASFDEEVTIDGNLEVVDGRTSPNGSIPPEFGVFRPGDGAEIWQGFMDLPPGACTIQLRARDNDGEVICTATEPFNIVADATSKVNLVLICDISFQAPVGMLDVDATFSFNVGNFCPDLFVLNCVDSLAKHSVQGAPATTYCEVRYRDGDSTCGQNCDPQTCVVTPEGLTCTPGPDPGVSTTVTCDTYGLIDCEGDFVFDPSCTWNGDATGTVGAGVPVPVLLGGPGPIQGGFYAGCNPPAGVPGLVITCTAVTTDGDADCDKTKQVSFGCPGFHFCDQFIAGDNLTDCDDGNDCTADRCDRPAGACVNTNIPAGGGNNCDDGGQPGVCDGAGNCVVVPCLPGSCNDNNECTDDNCNSLTGNCDAPIPNTDPCNGNSGMCDGAGSCVDNCAGVDCSDGDVCTDDVCTSVGGPTCSNPAGNEGGTCDAGGGPGSGSCQSGVCT